MYLPGNFIFSIDIFDLVTMVDIDLTSDHKVLGVVGACNKIN